MSRAAQTKKNTMKTCGNLVLPIVIASALALTACASGRGTGSTKSLTAATTKAQGFYLGEVATTNPEVVAPFQLLILENDEFWWMYGGSSPHNLVINYFIQGQGISTGTTFASKTGTDFRMLKAINNALQANYVANVSIDGTVTVPNFSAAVPHFSATFSAVPPLQYDYNAAANLAPIVGTWFLNSLDRTGAAINIGATGVITGNSGACALTGTITPRESRKNVFNTSITFGPYPCDRAGLTCAGIGLSYTIEGGGTRQLIIAGVNSSRTVSTALFGTRTIRSPVPGTD